eukprot:3710071-Pyramimonas_sp.AAC.1
MGPLCICSPYRSMALSIQIFIKMDRVDCAEKQLKAMMNIDDDATCTQLAQAWVNIALGGSKIQEAFYIFQELGDKYAWTVRLYNGSAVCNMQMGQYEEAERELLEALNKDPKDADTLSNLAVISLHLGKPNARYIKYACLRTKPILPPLPRTLLHACVLVRAACCYVADLCTTHATT